MSTRNGATNSKRTVGAAPAKGTSASLAAEAAEMEARLVELRRAMEAERAKREKAAAAGSGGFWRSAAAPGQLRHTTSAQNNSTASSTLPCAPSIPSDAAITAQPSYEPSVAAFQGQSRQWSGTTASQQQQANFQVPRTAVPSQPQQVHIEAKENNSLAQGSFDEAESHGSFLEALREWRAANGRTDTQQAQPAGKANAAVNKSSTSTETSAATTTEPVQTSQCKPVTYFDRLMLNSASRQAGRAASGAVIETLQQGLSTSPLESQQAIHSMVAMQSLTSTKSSAGGSSSQVYAVETAMTPAPADTSLITSPQRHKGLDILEELERLEMQHRRAVQHYDSDEEWAALLSPQVGTRWMSADELVVSTQHSSVGLTKGARLPDAILLPCVDEEDDSTKGTN